jgi:hypothetical protein
MHICRFSYVVSKSNDPGERLNSLYWVPFQAVQVAWSLGKLLTPEEILGSAPGSTAFAASAACTALVQSVCLISGVRYQKSEEPALEVASYCRKVLKYLLPAVQALQKQHSSRRMPPSEDQAAEAANSDTTSSATSSSNEGSNTSSSNGSDPSTYAGSNLQTTLLLLIAALHFPSALGGYSINDDISINVEEWAPQLVTLGFEALSLLCDLVEDEEWLSAAKQHQPLLLLQATEAGMEVGCGKSVLSSPAAWDEYHRSHETRHVTCCGRACLLKAQAVW